MAEFTVRRGSVRVPAFEGYGAQFNQNVFAQVTADEGVTQHHCHKLKDHVKDLGPQFVRIFFNGRPGPGGWKLRPSYELTRLFTHTVKPRWNVIDVDGPSDDRLVVGFEKPGGALTVIGLDTRGGLSNSPPSTVISYELGGLPLGSVFAVTTLPPPVLT